MDNTILTISVVVTGCAVLLQAGILVGMFIAMRRTSAKMESLAEEVKREGVTANCVLPRIIDTPENRAAMPKADPSRWATAAEIAAVVVFLSTDEASGITGAAIPIVART